MRAIKYKLYDESNNCSLDQILINRGIPEDQIQTWLNAGWPEVNDWQLLNYYNELNSAVVLVSNIINSNQDMLVVVDSDCDGFTSSAILINYLYTIYPEYVKNHLSYFLHSGKQHGLEDVNVPDNISLVVCPDSSSNDYEIHKELSDRGINVLVLDHHEAPCISEDAIIINNQLCDYPNKSFSGAGITWQFCRAYDSEFGFDYANDFLDLCALGNCGDMMDYRSLETKAIVNLGFKNIHNPFFYYMIEKNKFSIDKMGGINYMSIAFYVVPFINAIVRSGTPEEKDLIFKSMLTQYAFEDIESGKRGHKGELIPLVEEAVRVAVNVKARQTKLQDAGMSLLESRIKEQNLLDNAIIILCCEPGEVEKNIAGLCANKIQAKYQRPTLVLTKSKTKDDKEYFYRGSARNYSHSEIADMRQLCEDTGLVEYAQGRIYVALIYLFH